LSASAERLIARDLPARGDDWWQTKERQMTLIDKLKGAVDEAVEKGKSAVGDNADKITSVIDTVTSTADSRTGGKYTEKITKLNETAKGGVSSIATPAEPAIPDAEVVEEA
jgi:hypothetical protein